MRNNVVIFLDIDGVLNGGHNDGYVDHTRVEIFNNLLRALSRNGLTPFIVISSAWRLKYDQSILKRRLYDAGFIGTIISTTPLGIYDRQDAINESVRLNRERFDAWIAIDDHNLDRVSNFHRTKRETGITIEDTQLILNNIMHQLESRT